MQARWFYTVWPLFIGVGGAIAGHSPDDRHIPWEPHVIALA